MQFRHNSPKKSSPEKKSVPTLDRGRIGLRSRGRIDFGIDYRSEDGLFLGFLSFCTGLGRKELESYGAGLKLRMEF